ncbi:MAG: DUF2341 domain-containing protein, partial [Bacteroidales bacterium]
MFTTRTGIRNNNFETLSVQPGPGRLYPSSSPAFPRYLKPVLLGLLLFLLALPQLGAQWLDGYCYRKQITIQESKIPDGYDLTDFPVLINISSDNDLRDESFGGYVNNSNGWDLVFASSTGVQLDHDVELYDRTTGEFIAWVKIPILDYDENTIIYLYFGHDTPASDPSTTDTWSNGFVSVYHLDDDENDALGINNGTNVGSDNIAGIINDGRDFEYVDTQDRIELGDFGLIGSSLTISAWIHPESFTIPDARILSKATGSDSQEHWWMLSTIDNTELCFWLRTGSTTNIYEPDVSILTTASWQYVSAVYDGSKMYIFHNGALNGTGLDITGNLNLGPSVDIAIGNQPFSAFADGEKPFDGIIDEVRISSVARTSSWLTAEYNNISSPGTFYTLGSLVDNPPTASAGSNQNLCGTLVATLDGNPSIGTGLWTQVGGVGTVTFTDATSATSDISVNLYGSYLLRWGETNGTCSDADTVAIDFNESPVSDAG